MAYMDKRLPKLEDIKLIRYPSEAVICQATGDFAFVESGWDEERQGYCSHIVLNDKVCPGAGGMCEKSPAFSADGRVLYFLSDADGRIQLYARDIASGRVSKLSSFRHGIVYYALAPDGRHAAVLTYMHRTEGIDDVLQEAGDAGADEPFITENCSYRKNGTRGFYKARTRLLYVMDTATGEAKYLFGEENDVSEPSWTPDSRFVLTVGEDDNGFTITSIDIACGEAKILLCDNSLGLSDDVSPVLMTDDMKKIVFTAEIAEEASLCHSSLFMADVDGGKAELIVAPEYEGDGLLPSVENVTGFGDGMPIAQLSADSKQAYYISSINGGVCIYSVPLKKGSVPTRITDDNRCCIGFRVFSDREALCLFGDAVHFVEIFKLDLKSGASERLTNMNPWLSEVELSEPDTLWTKTADGAMDMQGWVIKPQGAKPYGKYPAVLNIHGGPKVAYCNGLNYEMQLMAACGIGSIYCNPRSSTGYGKDFADEDAAWDTRAFDDVMAFVKAAGKHFDWIDGKRLGITGKSYGGHVTVWAAAHSYTFRAASVHGAIVSEHVMYASSDSSAGDFSDEDGTLVDFLSEYIEKSPVAYADNITIPLLIVQGDRDYRCPKEGAYQLFTAIKEYHPDVPVRFILLPDSEHGVTFTGPIQLRLMCMEENIKWFGKYL